MFVNGLLKNYPEQKETAEYDVYQNMLNDALQDNGKGYTQNLEKYCFVAAPEFVAHVVSQHPEVKTRAEYSVYARDSEAACDKILKKPEGEGFTERTKKYEAEYRTKIGEARKVRASATEAEPAQPTIAEAPPHWTERMPPLPPPDIDTYPSNAYSTDYLKNQGAKGGYPR